MVCARVGTGRPVGLLAGDSIQAGATEYSIPGFMSPRGVQGYWQRGLDDNTQSKRIAFGTLALEGARPSDWQNRTAWSRKLDAVAKATAANGGKPPFTFIGSNHGNNSATVPNPYTWLTGFWQVCKTEWPGVPIYHSEMLARASSSDGYQSLAGQTVAAADAYNGGTNPGIRWTANELIGKGALTGDPSAQARVDGWIAGSFAPWRAGSFDTGANRDKQAVIAFDTTLAADSAANNTTLTLASTSGLALGDMLIVNPGGTGSYDAIVRTISGNVVTLSGASGTAMTTGTRVTASLNDRTGLHPSTRHHQKIAMEVVVPWNKLSEWGCDDEAGIHHPDHWSYSTGRQSHHRPAAWSGTRRLRLHGLLRERCCRQRDPSGLPVRRRQLLHGGSAVGFRTDRGSVCLRHEAPTLEAADGLHQRPRRHARRAPLHLRGPWF
ncbi:hypothetical protein DHODJN_00615 [Methylorubrum extorquens]